MLQKSNFLPGSQTAISVVLMLTKWKYKAKKLAKLKKDFLFFTLTGGASKTNNENVLTCL